ncbi:hypothetical protein D9758_009656 [Tetrapyrgos nigripes]|uniref:F-box domain-containing protein n=1 Tax=Tetrapyrgos nigripes TaxID=182062 RepID=A0A8H5FQB9_9AGAR|nr:hypothetical protein D9758_009656 [Tetrapyrgos nigripes]
MLQDLPTELYEAILSHVPESELPQTTLSLTRVFPYHGISTRALFRDVRLKDAEQVLQLYRRLRKQSADNQEEDPAPTWVRTFNLETWTADAEIVLNLVQLLPNLTRLVLWIGLLVLWIGPTNFMPEHLEEMFDLRRKSQGSRCLSCVGKLEYLSFRFRPYVRQASYYHFLKGAYFDSALEAISCWPSTNLPKLSIIQDPLTTESSTSAGSDVQVAPPSVSFSSGLPKLNHDFAQPLVFFRLDTTVPELLRSDAIRLSLTSFRIRLPARSLMRSLTHAPPPNPPSFGAPVTPGEAPTYRYSVPPRNSHLPPSPYLKLLDLSTSSVSEDAIALILVRYPALTHLIADDCGILKGELGHRDGGQEWAKLSKECALAGSLRAKNREKKVKQWIEEEKTAAMNKQDATGSRGREHSQAGEGESSAAGRRRPKKGRKGLATATISLKKNDAQNHNGANTISRPRADPALFIQKIRILPPTPTLQAFSTSLVVPAGSIPAEAADILSSTNDLWERGWAEGIKILTAIRNRLRASWRTGSVRVLRFATVEEMQSGVGSASSYESDSSRPQTPDGNGGSSRSPARSISSLSSHLSGKSEMNYGEEGLGGLVDVVDESEFDVNLIGTPAGNAPVLCLAGSSEVYNPVVVRAQASSLAGSVHAGRSRPGDNLRVVRPHAEGCPHELGKDTWLDSW